MRYDPIWRRIRPDEYTNQLEGKFGDRVQRLDRLNNWGPLAWLFDHATATKQAHHYGVERNAMAFLAADELRAKYSPSLRAASHVMHWGHLPLSYGGEEALLRAAHVSPDVAKVVEAMIGEVISFGNLDCDRKESHDCADAVRNGDRPFDLYRWLSAWLVLKEWKKLWRAIKAAAPPDAVEEDVKEQLVRTLVCREERGWDILGLCNQADYVCRDLLQAGTAWLTVDIEALWEGNPLGSDAAREWSLIHSARRYLDDRFFHSHESLLVHTLAARAVAGGLLADEFSADMLATLTTCGDDYFSAKLKPYHRDRLSDVHDVVVAGRLRSRWVHVGTFHDISFDAASRLEMEDYLSGKSGAARVSYPFYDGLSIVVETGVGGALPAGFAGRSRRYGTVHLHHELPTDGSLPRVRTVLDVVSKITTRSAFQRGDQVMSWLLQAKTEERPSQIDACMTDVFDEHQNELRELVGRLAGMKSLAPILQHGYVGAVIANLKNAEADDGSSNLGGALSPILLGLPYAWHKTKAGSDAMTRIREAATSHAKTAMPKSRRGYFLELAVTADEWLAPGEPQDRFVFRGVTLLGKDGRPEREWDVVRLDLDADKGWSLTATECAIARSDAKDEEAREKLEYLGQRLQGRFADLTGYQTKLATAKTNSASPDYADARRGFVETL